MLDGIRATVLALIDASCGNEDEAEDLAREIVAYVDFHWWTLRLNILARHPELWERYLDRQVYRRWVARLSEGRAELTPPVVESLSRARILAVADRLGFGALDRALLDHIYYHGFSANETAAMFEMDHCDLVARLRPMLAAVRRESDSSPS